MFGVVVVMGNCMCTRRVRHSCCTRRRAENTCLRLGSCSCPPNGAPSPSCVFYSPRIQGLHEGKKTELETTRDHYTRMDHKSDVEVERVDEENRKYFDEVLMKHPEWGAFFSKFEDLNVGEKIGEGAQDEIFATTSENEFYPLVAKIFKKNVSLKNLEQQWPPQVISRSVGYPFRNILGGAFIRDGEYKNRFAFVMRRRWGDLRTFIDHCMLELLRNNNHVPPISDYKMIYLFLWGVSSDLRTLHEGGVLHRDIKASNVLLQNDPNEDTHICDLIDFECSLGVMGTGFWRAPEILEQLQKGVPSDRLVFTEKADIYSFGMLCYETITGCIPFEGHPQNDYSIVIRGDRPRLPDDLDSMLVNIVYDCWRHDPQDRPNASEIDQRLQKLGQIYNWFDMK